MSERPEAYREGSLERLRAIRWPGGKRIFTAHPRLMPSLRASSTSVTDAADV